MNDLNIKITNTSSSTNLLSIDKETCFHIYSLAENIDFNFQIITYLINCIKCYTLVLKITLLQISQKAENVLQLMHSLLNKCF